MRRFKSILVLMVGMIMTIGVSGCMSEKRRQWFNKTFNEGDGQATSNTYISVDTDLLRNYANRLDAVNKRIEKLDGRIDGLYNSVGLLDLIGLVQADLLMGYSFRIRSCVNYLNDTAYEFEEAERSIANQL